MYQYLNHFGARAINRIFSEGVLAVVINDVVPQVKLIGRSVVVLVAHKANHIRADKNQTPLNKWDLYR
jgi:hypothetical protein